MGKQGPKRLRTMTYEGRKAQGTKATQDTRVRRAQGT